MGFSTGKFHLLGKAHDFKHIAGLKLLLGIDSHRHFRTAERLDGNAIHERLGAQLIDGQAGSFFRNEHLYVFGIESEQLRVVDLRADPAFVLNDEFMTSGKHDFVALTDLHRRSGGKNLVALTHALHEEPMAEAAEMLLYLRYSLRGGEMVGRNLIGTERNGAVAVDVCRVGGERGMIELRLKVARLLAYLLQAAEHGRTEIAQNPCRTDSAEYVCNRIAYRNHIYHGLLLVVGDMQPADGVGTDADYR